MIKSVALLAAGMLLCASVAFSQLYTEKPKAHHSDFECADCHGTPEPVKGVEEGKCLECHDSRDAVMALTVKLDPNPHFGHEDGLACKTCHKEHEMSVLFCDDCHQWGYLTP